MSSRGSDISEFRVYTSGNKELVSRWSSFVQGAAILLRNGRDSFVVSYPVSGFVLSLWGRGSVGVDPCSEV